MGVINLKILESRASSPNQASVFWNEFIATDSSDFKIDSTKSAVEQLWGQMFEASFDMIVHGFVPSSLSDRTFQVILIDDTTGEMKRGSIREEKISDMPLRIQFSALHDE
ncbi:MAG TPA: hypothetical protein VLE96_06830 [Chlamydiales bacterium]|nr:hypothetical protein [Chlamydiales bacterium]